MCDSYVNYEVHIASLHLNGLGRLVHIYKPTMEFSNISHPEVQVLLLGHI